LDIELVPAGASGSAGGQDEEAYAREQHLQLEREKEAIVANRNMVQDEKRRLLAETEARTRQLAAEGEARRLLAARISVAMRAVADVLSPHLASFCGRRWRASC